MTCPQCNTHIPARALWSSSGLSSVVCLHCQVALCPTALSAILVFALSVGLGDLALLFLRHKGAAMWVTFVGFFVVFAAVFALAAPVLLRMRLKDHGDPHLSSHRA
ncbi:MAG: hypothetical protein WA192_18185 [Candidatus Acidiferrales bacterium]